MSELSPPNTLMLSFYSALSGVSFVGLLAVPQLSPYLSPSWVYETLLVLLAVSTVMMAAFAVVQYIILERPNVRDLDLYIKRLSSDHAVKITQLGIGIFLLSFFLLVFGLSIFAFIFSLLCLGVLLFCVRRFFRSSSDKFLTED